MPIACLRLLTFLPLPLLSVPLLRFVIALFTSFDADRDVFRVAAMDHFLLVGGNLRALLVDLVLQVRRGLVARIVRGRGANLRLRLFIPSLGIETADLMLVIDFVLGH